MAVRINQQDYNTTRDEKTYREHGDKTTTSIGNNVGGWGTAHGTYHIADNPNLYEIQRSNNFEFVIDFGDEPMLYAGLTTDTADAKGAKFGTTYAQEVVRMSVSQASIPHFSQQPIEIKRGNSSLKYAGVPQFTDGSLTLNDYIGIDTKAVLMAWQNLSYNVKTEKVGLASDYKKTAHLIEYTPDLQKVRTWTLYGCWVAGISEQDYSSDDNSKHNITVNICYDKAILDSF